MNRSEFISRREGVKSFCPFIFKLVSCLICTAGPALCAGLGWGVVFWVGIMVLFGIWDLSFLGKKRQQKNLGLA